MGKDLWTVCILLGFSVAVTVVADALVAELARLKAAGGRSPASVGARLAWMGLIFIAGLIAVRYVERIDSRALGYAIFGSLAFILSLIWAFLFRRAQQEKDRGPEQRSPEALRRAWHDLSYLLFAVVIYLAFSWALGRPVELVLLAPVCVGALLPDLDSRGTLVGRLVPFISRRLEARFGHRHEVHSLGAAVILAVVTAPLIPIAGTQAWYAMPIGFVAHLVLDLLRPAGSMVLWPLSRVRYSILSGPLGRPGGLEERWLAVVLLILAVTLLAVVDVGPADPVAVAPAPYEQALEQYYSLRGRNLVWADVEGVWQATGRRIRARFEILNAAGMTYIMLDRYTGNVFTAGRGAGDNLFLDRISVSAGSPVSVKPVEIELRHQRLAEALPMLYEMQGEAGLQHIFVSGDVVLSFASGESDLGLPVDYAQTRIRKIWLEEAEHYSLHYLAASELIELANHRVKEATLIIVATYIVPAVGPTGTPLPDPPPKPDAGRSAGGEAS